MLEAPAQFTAVYGPVHSWRFGQSLGIDPIGLPTTCSFNCVYCQLGEITHVSQQRQVFVPSTQIQTELLPYLSELEKIDVITLSGSGEPTLAANLGEIISIAQALLPSQSHCRVGVLTNGSLLQDAEVRSALNLADFVAVKIDALSADQLKRVNRPLDGIDITDIYSGLQKFRAEYTGHLAIQTMLLSPWTDTEKAAYCAMMQALNPAEIQLNVPQRPKAATHHLAARENNSASAAPYDVRRLRTVEQQFLQDFAAQLQTQVGIPVRYPNIPGGA